MEVTILTGKDLDAMTAEEVKSYIDSVDVSEIDRIFEPCTFACIKRVYEKYYGFRLTSTKTRERAIFEFKETKWHQHRTGVLLNTKS